MVIDSFGNLFRRLVGIVMVFCKDLGWKGLVEVFGGGKRLVYNEFLLGIVLRVFIYNFMYFYNNFSR